MNILRLCVLAACFIYALPTFARDYVVAFSPHQTTDAAKAQATQILQFATALNGGDQITFMDGFNLTTIGTFSVPDNPRYKSPKARLNVNRNTVSALMNFAKKTSGSGNNLHVPKLLRHVAQNNNRDVLPEVILLGSPFFNDPSDPNFSMAGGLIPSDGHITASRADTPFGTKEYLNALRDLRIHWFVMNNGDFQSDQHRFYVERFWTLFIQAQGGLLVTNTPDLTTVLSRAAKTSISNKHGFTIQKSDKLEMIRLIYEVSEKPLFKRDVSKTPLERRQIERAENVLIGITWDCENCDLDLYAFLVGSEFPLYFGNTKTPEGVFWKDFRNSPQTIGGFETIEFSTPIDLRRLRIAVNFYDGDVSKPINGGVRICYRTLVIPALVAFPSLTKMAISFCLSMGKMSIAVLNCI